MVILVILGFLVILVILVIVRMGNCTDTCVFFISPGDAQSDLEPQLSLSSVSFDGETDTRVADIEARRHRDHHERRVRGSRGQGCQARQGQGEQGEETSRSSRGCRAFIFILIFVRAIALTSCFVHRTGDVGSGLRKVRVSSGESRRRFTAATGSRRTSRPGRWRVRRRWVRHILIFVLVRAIGLTRRVLFNSYRP